MSEKPILFSGPMVRALLEAKKTQTRRIITPNKRAGLNLFDGTWSDSYVLDPGNHSWREYAYPWRVGDHLWVRESIGRRTASFLGIEATNGTEEAFYAADGEDVLNEHEFNLCPWWKNKGSLPAIHMPRWASRLTLHVTDVRVQRLQEISEDDAWSEGVWNCGEDDGGRAQPGEGIILFRNLWNSLNAARGYGWDANPWVVALTFTVEKNSDVRFTGRDSDGE